MRPVSKYSLNMRPATLTIYGLTVMFFTYLALPSGIKENDTFLHVLLGDWILDHGGTSGNPAWIYGPQNFANWTNTQGLPEVLFSTLHSSFGWWGVALIQILAPAAIALTIYILASRLIPRPAVLHSQMPAIATIIVTALTLYVASPSTTLRPQTFSYIIAPLAVLVLYRIAVTGVLPKFYILPGVTFIWCLFHGYGLMFPPAVLTAFFGYHTVRIMLSDDRIEALQRFKTTLLKSAPVLVLTFVATVLTPAGLNIYSSAFKIREASQSVISEWLPATVNSSSFLLLILLITVYAFFVGYSLRCWTGKIVKAKLISLTSELILVASIIAGLSFYVRSELFASYLLLLFILIRVLNITVSSKTLLMSKPVYAPNRIVKALITVIITVAILAIPFVKYGQVEPQQNLYPKALTQAILNQPGEHKIFTDYNLSSYILSQVSTAGKNSVSIDGRTDLYSAQLLEDYVSLNYDKTLTDDERTNLWINYRTATDVIIYENTPLYQYLLKNGYKSVQSLPAVNTDGQPATIAWLVKN